MSKKIKDKFTPIRNDWKPLHGYPRPVINKDGNVSIRGGKPQTKPIDHFDLLLYSEIAGYEVCFASPATLADGIGLYGDKADEEVVKRLASGAAIGIIRASYREVMGQKMPQIIYEIDHQRVEELVFEMEKVRTSQKVCLSQKQIICRESTIKVLLLNYLLNYLQNYIPDYPPDQLPDYSPDHLPDHLPDDSPNNDETIHQTTYFDEKSMEVERVCRKIDAPGTSAASSTSREERGREEEDSVLSVSRTEENEVLPPHVAGGHATVKDIFETYVNPLMKLYGWTYADIDAVVEEATGQRQKIKDIQTQEQRDDVYHLFEHYMTNREKPEQKKGGQPANDNTGEYVSTAELMDLAKKFVAQSVGAYPASYFWERSIPMIVEEAVGENVLIKDITDQAQRRKLKENLLYYMD